MDVLDGIEAEPNDRDALLSWALEAIRAARATS